MLFSPSTVVLRNAVNSARPALKPQHLAVSSQSHRRNYAAASSPPTSQSEPHHVAILGAGITALTAAYQLSLFPNAPKITIFEKQDRVGGWLQSKYVPLADGSGEVLFETGPRNIRPTIPLGTTTLAIWEELGLAPNMILTPKDSVAAKSRWLFYPDHLVELPNAARGLLANIWSLLTEELYRGYLLDVIKEQRRPPRDDSLADESVESFVSRRANKTLSDKVVSAVLHGIYAGDAARLSVRSILGDVWWAEKKSGSVMNGMARMNKDGFMKHMLADLLVYNSQSNRPTSEMLDKVAGASTVTLDGGMEMFARRLEATLRANDNVHFRMETEVQSVDIRGDPKDERNTKMLVTTAGASSAPEEFDQVISTVPARTISYLTTSEKHPGSLPTLAQVSSVDVNVVNLYYTDPNLLPVSGFGYLIPQATPWSQNPELALGVVFDSDVVPFGQDRLKVKDTSRVEQKSGTKLTVMLGGHYYSALDSVPDEKTALAQAKSLVARQLGITAEPAAHLVSRQMDAIPQYYVGHIPHTLASAYRHISERFGGRLKVAGSSYSGVGINDCVVAGMHIAGLTVPHEDPDSKGLPRWWEQNGLEWAAADADQHYVRAEDYFEEKGFPELAQRMRN